MPYATLTDLIERAGEAELRQIADRDRDSIPDPDVIEAALTGADTLIDGYVFARYSRPLPAVPPVLTVWAVSIARYLLHRNGAPDHVAQDYKDTLSALKDVQAGRYALIAETGNADPDVKLGQVMAEHPAQVFTPTKLRGW